MGRKGFIVGLALGVLLGGGISYVVVLSTPSWQARHSSDLKPFLESYFAAWSRGDIEAYKSLFHKNARITYVEDGTARAALSRDAFVRQQAAAIARAKVPMSERMTSFSATEDDVAATVSAQWELKKGDETVTGVDLFTLIRDTDGKWKIISLVYYVAKDWTARSMSPPASGLPT